MFSDVLREIDIRDLNEMCSEWSIPFLQKAKLKAAIKNLQKEESDSKLQPVLLCMQKTNEYSILAILLLSNYPVD